MEELDRITIHPNVCLGQPTIQEVLEAYPELEREDIDQAIKYAARSGDYLAIRNQIFENETVETLSEKIRAYQQRQQAAQGKK